MGRALLIINTEADRQKAAHWIGKAPWGARITFQAAKRSVDQNSLMWAALTDVAQQVEHMGQRYTPEAWKILFMHACGREVRFLPGLDGKTFVPWGQSSSDLSKQEMTDLIEFIFSWGAEHGVSFNNENPSENPPSSDGGSDGSPEPPSTPAVAASPNEPASGGHVEAGEPEADHPDTAAPASVIPSDEDRAWLKLVAKMLWAATGVGEQDVLKRQMAGIREGHTPATINDTARAKANSINQKCKLVCFGEASAADVLPLIAGIAGCDVKDITT